MAERELGGAALHHAILRRIVDTGVAPTLAELAEHFELPAAKVRTALEALAADHGVVLHPGSARIWVAHPFANFPTGHVLRRGDRVWWSNCAWCSLGAAQLLGGEISIFAPLDGEERQVELRVHDGRLLDDGYVVHFPVPMTRAWDNVIYTCSTMLTFESPEAVEDWCARHHMAMGDVQPIATVADLAAVWYGRHLDRDWRKWTVDEARAIFERFGLSHEIWRLPDGDERF
jgi:hypothetical protein